MEKEKDLEYWKNNAQEDYLKTPISVLSYIGELENATNTPTEKEFLEAAEVEGSILYCGMAGKGFCPYEKKNGECIMKDPCKNHTMQTK